MIIQPEQDSGSRNKLLHHENGRTYFSRKSERRLFFILTVMMLAAGILTKIGLF